VNEVFVGAQIEELAEQGEGDGERPLRLYGLRDDGRAGDEWDAGAVGVGRHHRLLDDWTLQRDCAGDAATADRGLNELGGLLDDDGAVGAHFEGLIEVDGAVGADHH
jgi:hypothetical protein